MGIHFRHRVASPVNKRAPLKLLMLAAMSKDIKQKLTSITIPDSVTHIGDRAFYDCSSLTSTIIPDSVAEIGHGVFKDCSALKFVVVPDNLSIDRGAKVPDSTAIITHHALNSYIANLQLQKNYPLQQKSMIYQLLRSNNPTQPQFATLATFIAAEDFKSIISQLPIDIVPYRVRAIYKYLLEKVSTYALLKFMTISDIKRARLTAKNIFPSGIRGAIDTLYNPSPDTEVKPKTISE